MNKDLKAAIIKRFGSQADFSQEIQVDESLISRVVHGRRSLSPEDVVKWSKVLKCDPAIIQETV